MKSRDLVRSGFVGEPSRCFELNPHFYRPPLLKVKQHIGPGNYGKNDEIIVSFAARRRADAYVASDDLGAERVCQCA